MTVMLETCPWTKPEREAWRPPPAMKPSEWAELHRYLRPGETARPGQWSNDTAPYLRGLMDLCAAPGVVQLNVKKAGQLGVSEALRNVLGYWAATDPDPAGLALPDQKKGRKIVEERILPMFRRTQVLRALQTGRAQDMTKEEIRLINGFILSLMWAGSATSTSSDPMRRVINDEVNKMLAWSGNEPDPVGRTWTRTRTYGELRFQANVSTPTNRAGRISLLFEGSTFQLYFKVPCPRCGHWQILVFPQLRWPKSDELDPKHQADEILQADSAHYVCERCQGKIEDREKMSMLRAGRWATKEDEIYDAEKVEVWPRGTRLGLSLGGLLCPWESWSRLAADRILCAGDREKLVNFRNEGLGEDWEDLVEKPRASVFRQKAERAPLEEGIVPAWAVRLLATVDTQMDHFKAVIRGWGGDMESARIWHGVIETFAELDELLFRHLWPVEQIPGQPKRDARLVELCLIDSGGSRKEGERSSRTMQVYRWGLRRRARVRIIKGGDPRSADKWIWRGTGLLDDNPSKDKRTKILLWHVATGHFRDLLTDLITQGIPLAHGKPASDPEIWHLNRRRDEDYEAQMSNMQKILKPTPAGAVEAWEEVQQGVPHDYFDCETYQVSAAYMARVHLLPSRAELERFRAERAARQAQEENAPQEDPAQRDRRKNRWVPTRIEP